MSSDRAAADVAATRTAPGPALDSSGGRRTGRGGPGATALASGLAGVGLVAAVLAGIRDPTQMVFSLGAVVPFCIVGAFIVSRRPRALVGWFLLLGGLSFALHDVAEQYVVQAVGGPGGLWSGAVLAAWTVEWIWIPAWSFVFIGIALVYPDGTLPSRRWRSVGVLAIVLPSGQLLAKMFQPGPLGALEEHGGLAVNNPIGIEGAGRVLTVIDEVMAAAFLPLAIAGVVALVVRYRRGGRTARLQLRWLMLVVVSFLSVFVLLNVASLLVVVPEPVTMAAITVAVAGYPISIAVAVTRYRLYEVDRILNRTAVYALVSAVLIGLYAGSVVVFQALLTPLTSGGDLAVAASTLAVAAAFGPVRRRAQRAVDRRFDRSRYDAQRAIGAFAQRLRDEVDIELLTTDVCDVVRSTVHPRAVALWLPEGAART